tara:strand:- start:576 stop:1730 length:1155 start_codon:yes stop_codon:yes gene_type:complete
LKANLKSKSTLDVLWKSLLGLTLLIYGLNAASSILVPIVTSLFLALLLNPIVSWLEKKGMNSILAIILTLLLVSIVVSSAVFYISTQAKDLIMDLPNLMDKFNAVIDKIFSQLNNLIGFSSTDQLDLLKDNADKLISSGGSIFTDAISVTSNVVTFITLIPIYIFFFLLYRKNFKHFLSMLSQKNKDSELLDIAVEIKKMTHSYISGLLIVISIIAILNTVGLLILGLKYALFMGVVSAILTVIPYIGVFIGASLPIMVALITKDSLMYPIGVVSIYAFVQFVEGNFITPNIIGSKVDVNPLAAIIALIIGGQIWGIIGMILAIPMCGIMKIIFSHYESTKPYALLLQSSSNAHREKESKPIELQVKKIFKRKKKAPEAEENND